MSWTASWSDSPQWVGGGVAVEEPGGGEHQRPRAHRRRAARAPAEAGDIGEEVLVGGRLEGANPPDDGQRVDGSAGAGHLADGDVGADAHAAVGANVRAARRRDQGPVARCCTHAGRDAEDLDGPRQVEQLQAVHRDHDHGSLACHAPIVRRPNAGGNDRSLTIHAKSWATPANPTLEAQHRGSGEAIEVADQGLRL
jgi:hypothetical protein